MVFRGEYEYVVVGHDEGLKKYKAFYQRIQRAEEAKRAAQEAKRAAQEAAVEEKRLRCLQKQSSRLAEIGVSPNAHIQVCWQLPNSGLQVRLGLRLVLGLRVLLCPAVNHVCLPTSPHDKARLGLMSSRSAPAAPTLASQWFGAKIEELIDGLMDGKGRQLYTLK